MHNWKEWFLTVLFPQKCFLCGRVLQGLDWICADCDLLLTDDLCPRCGKAWDECICGRISYDGASVPLWYRDGVRYGIHRFKYDGRTYYARFISELMVYRLKEDLDEISFDLVTYVPMYWRKERARGYCQSRLLAQHVADRLLLPIEATLFHTGNGAVQMEQKGLVERKENAQKSFLSMKRDLNGLRILLVDDILTTGYTLSCCADLLKEQGAKVVYVAAIATVKRPPDNPRK